MRKALTGMQDVSSAAVGSEHVLILKNDGSVWAVGRNSDGQLGDGTVLTKSLPVYVMGEVSAVAAGAAHSLFLKKDGTVWAAGSNSFGQLGDERADQRGQHPRCGHQRAGDGRHRDQCWWAALLVFKNRRNCLGIRQESLWAIGSRRCGWRKRRHYP